MTTRNIPKILNDLWKNELSDYQRDMFSRNVWEWVVSRVRNILIASEWKLDSALTRIGRLMSRYYSPEVIWYAEQIISRVLAISNWDDNPPSLNLPNNVDNIIHITPEQTASHSQRPLDDWNGNIDITQYLNDLRRDLWLYLNIPIGNIPIFRTGKVFMITYFWPILIITPNWNWGNTLKLYSGSTNQLVATHNWNWSRWELLSNFSRMSQARPDIQWTHIWDRASVIRLRPFSQQWPWWYNLSPIIWQETLTRLWAQIMKNWWYILMRDEGKDCQVVNQNNIHLNWTWEAWLELSSCHIGGAIQYCKEWQECLIMYNPWINLFSVFPKWSFSLSA